MRASPGRACSANTSESGHETAAIGRDPGALRERDRSEGHRGAGARAPCLLVRRVERIGSTCEAPARHSRRQADRGLGMAENFLIGIDLGGTKIAAAAFDLEGNRLGKVARLPTMARMQPVVTLTNMKRVVKQAKAAAGLQGTPRVVGMGSSGPLDPKNRVLHDRDSLPNLAGFHVGRFSEAEFGAPLHLETMPRVSLWARRSMGRDGPSRSSSASRLEPASGAASPSRGRSIPGPPTMLARWPIAGSAIQTSTMPVQEMASCDSIVGASPRAPSRVWTRGRSETWPRQAMDRR